jgi:hypothetical protein
VETANVGMFHHEKWVGEMVVRTLVCMHVTGNCC